MAIQNDPILANRALGKLADRWPEWRPMLGKCLGLLMTNDQFHWPATRLLAGEARLDADNVVKLIGQHWDQPEKDGLVFRVIEQSGVISDAVENLVKTILGRTQIDEYLLPFIGIKLGWRLFGPIKRRLGAIKKTACKHCGFGI